MEGIQNNRFNGLENFKSASTAKRAEEKPKFIKEDPYMNWPLRGLAYTNEIGEIVRPMSGLAANLLWIPAIGYIAADITDKYKHDPNGEDKTSKRRASKQLSFQLLASVLLPTAAVKAGQKLTNIISAKGKTKLSLNDREKFTNLITKSMNHGDHEKFADAATGLVDRTKYTEHIVESIAEKAKHKETRNAMYKPFERVLHYLKKPFEAKPKPENIKKYVAQTIDNIMDTREMLLKGEKPKNVSDKLFKAFEKVASTGNLKQKKSAAFTVIKKMQNKKLFGNNALKSLGGMIALAIMMKPIDNFVEHVLIKKYIGPTIDKLGPQKPWKPLNEVVKENEEKSAA